MKKISQIIPIVIPLYNEILIAKKLSAEIKYYLDGQESLLFILVADHCTDGTYEYLTSEFLNQPEVKVIKNNKDQGYGSAIRCGFELASRSYDWALTIDSDLSNPISESINLINFIKTINMSNHVLVKGNRFKNFFPNFKSVPLSRTCLSFSANLLSRFITFGITQDPTNGHRAVNLNWYKNQNFTTNGFPSILEELYLAIKSGLSITDFSTVLRYDLAIRQKSSFTFNYNTILGYLKYLLKILLWRIARF